MMPFAITAAIRMMMMMLALFVATTITTTTAFVVGVLPTSPSRTITSTSFTTSTTSTTSTTPLYAIGALAKKAKQADLKQYVADGIPDDVMAVYQDMKAKMTKSMDDEDWKTSSAASTTVGPLQEALTKRKGTLTVIAEFKRKNSETPNGYINTDIFVPELLSPIFRENGAAAVAVMADRRMGGCDYTDLAAVMEEQRRSRHKVPGPIPVINNDFIIDEIQVARSASMGCAACVIHMAMVGVNETATLLQACRAAQIEAIVAVSTAKEARTAVDMGARLLSVIHVEGVPGKVAVVQEMLDANDKATNPADKICLIANILARNNKQLQEIEEAWALRDVGFNAAWVGEALYKSGADFSEHPGAIIKSMKSKSSTKWASPKAYSGRGEGAREYLGDIMM